MRTGGIFVYFDTTTDSQLFSNNGIFNRADDLFTSTIMPVKEFDESLRKDICLLFSDIFKSLFCSQPLCDTGSSINISTPFSGSDLNETELTIHAHKLTPTPSHIKKQNSDFHRVAFMAK